MSHDHSFRKPAVDARARVLERAFDVEPYEWLEHDYPLIPIVLGKYDSERQFCTLACPLEEFASKCSCPNPKHREMTPATHKGSIMVHLKGLCRHAWTTQAQCSYGLWFGPGSKHNASHRIRSRRVNTTQKAEIYAAMQALTYIRTKIQQKEVLRSNRIQQIVLVCDSEYLLEAITHNVLHWRAAHWRAERGGKLVRNARLMQKLDDLVCQFEDEGITVEFWEVERELNEDATEFAARALRDRNDELMAMFAQLAIEHQNKARRQRHHAHGQRHNGNEF